MTPQRIAKFKKWLQAHGAELLIPTNEYEVVRFRANGKVSIIYRDSRGGNSFTNEARAAYDAYHEGRAWSAGNKAERKPIARSVKIRSIVDRDGDSCFFCKNPVSVEDESIEHLLPVAHGGSSHISNLALAHRKCNLYGGHMSVMEKIKIRERSIFPKALA